MAETNFKRATLKKRINGNLIDLYPTTSTDMIFLPDGRSLTTVLNELIGSTLFIRTDLTETSDSIQTDGTPKAGPANAPKMASLFDDEDDTGMGDNGVFSDNGSNLVFNG